MNAVEVVAALADEGIELALRDGRLCVRPSGRARRELVSLVRTHAADLRVLLAGIDTTRAEDDREEIEERAAIMQYEGGLSRADAERLAEEAHAAPRTLPERRRWRGEGLDLDDLRPCLWCRNLTRTGRCLAAWRGELRAARDYQPTFPGLPQRCIGYSPPADDPDQRPGRERWPEMIAWQARIPVGERTTHSAKNARTR